MTEWFGELPKPSRHKKNFFDGVKDESTAWAAGLYLRHLCTKLKTGFGSRISRLHRRAVIEASPTQRRGEECVIELPKLSKIKHYQRILELTSAEGGTGRFRKVPFNSDIATPFRENEGSCINRKGFDLEGLRQVVEEGKFLIRCRSKRFADRRGPIRGNGMNHFSSSVWISESRIAELYLIRGISRPYHRRDSASKGGVAVRDMRPKPYTGSGGPR